VPGLAIRSRHHDLPPGAGIGIDRQRTRPYDDHGRDTRLGPLPWTAAKLRGRGPSTSGTAHPHRASRPQPFTSVAKQRGRHRPHDAQQVTPSTPGRARRSSVSLGLSVAPRSVSSAAPGGSLLTCRLGLLGVVPRRSSSLSCRSRAHRRRSSSRRQPLQLAGPRPRRPACFEHPACGRSTGGSSPRSSPRYPCSSPVERSTPR
jgi:hypothetical protein